MGRGKELCKLLKDVRVKIAAENDIDYTPVECTHKGDCRGTCPQCEAELRWIQHCLDRRLLAGKIVKVAGISAGILMMGSCGKGTGTHSSDTVVDSISSEAVLVSEDTIATDSPRVEPLTKVDVQPMLSEEKMGEVPFWDEDDQEEADNERVHRMEMNSEIDNSDHTTTKEKEFSEPVYVGGVDDELFEFDTFAQFPGGVDSLMRFLSKNIIYPKEAVENNIEGKVILKFIVSESGRVSHVAIVKSVHPLLDNEAVRVVSKLPRFIPAQYKGRNKDSFFSLPISFRLPDSIANQHKKN